MLNKFEETFAVTEMRILLGAERRRNFGSQRYMHILQLWIRFLTDTVLNVTMIDTTETPVYMYSI